MLQSDLIFICSNKLTTVHSLIPKLSANKASRAHNSGLWVLDVKDLLHLRPVWRVLRAPDEALDLWELLRSLGLIYVAVARVVLLRPSLELVPAPALGILTVACFRDGIIGGQARRVVGIADHVAAE